MQDRYQAFSREDKSRILDEFTAVAGHHRKHGIRLLAQSEGGLGKVRAEAAISIQPLPVHLLDGPTADLQELGQFPLAHSLRPLHPDVLPLPLGQAGPPARETPLGPRLCLARGRALPDRVPPPLAEGEHHRELELAGGRRGVEVLRQGPELHSRMVQTLDHLQPIGQPPGEPVDVGDHQGVPLDHQVQQFQEAAAVVLGSAGLLGSDITHGAAGADQPLHLKVQILVLGLSHRDPGIAVHRHLTTPLAGIPEVWLSASGVATGFSSHPLSYDRGEFTAGGWKQPCFQPGPPDAAGPVSVATKNCYPSRVQLPRIPGALRQRRCGPGAITDPYGGLVAACDRKVSFGYNRGNPWNRSLR